MFKINAIRSDKIPSDLKKTLEKVEQKDLCEPRPADIKPLDLDNLPEPTWYESIWWRIERLWEWPFEKARDLKWFYQRGKRGYSDFDTWSLDHYLAEWLPKALKQMKKYSHGYPAVGGAKTPEEWDKRLDEMIEGLEAADEMLNGELKERESIKDWIKREKKLEKVFNKGMKVFHKFFFSLWD